LQTDFNRKGEIMPARKMDLLFKAASPAQENLKRCTSQEAEDL